MTESESKSESADSTIQLGTTNPPSVTCVVLAYNHAKYIEEALDSAFAQSYPNLRIIVTDDASTDDSQMVIRRYLKETGHDDVLFIAHRENRGLCATLNEVLGHIDSDYVAFISADDTQTPTRFDRQVALIEKVGAEYGICHANAARITEGGAATGRSYLDGVDHPVGDVFLAMLENHFITPPSTLIRRSVFDVVGLYDESLDAEDYDMDLRISREFKVCYVDADLTSYRDTPGSLFDVVQADNVRHLRNARKVLMKQLGYSDAGDRIIKRRVASFAKSAYLSGASPLETRADLKFCLSVERRATTYVYLALTTSRVPGRAIAKFVTLTRRIRLRMAR